MNSIGAGIMASDPLAQQKLAAQMGIAVPQCAEEQQPPRAPAPQPQTPDPLPESEQRCLADLSASGALTSDIDEIRDYWNRPEHWPLGKPLAPSTAITVRCALSACKPGCVPASISGIAAAWKAFLANISIRDAEARAAVAPQELAGYMSNVASMGFSPFSQRDVMPAPSFGDNGEVFLTPVILLSGYRAMLKSRTDIACVRYRPSERLVGVRLPSVAGRLASGELLVGWSESETQLPAGIECRIYLKSGGYYNGWAYTREDIQPTQFFAEHTELMLQNIAFKRAAAGILNCAALDDASGSSDADREDRSNAARAIDPAGPKEDLAAKLGKVIPSIKSLKILENYRNYIATRGDQIGSSAPGLLELCDRTRDALMAAGAGK